MRRMTTLSVWTGALAIAVTSTACSDSTERKASDAARETGNAAARVGDAAKAAGSDVAGAATEAARDVAGAAKDATRSAGAAIANGGRAADAALETMDVKMAIVADSRVDASNINVDTDHVTKTVTLKGRVPTAAQKTIAEQIAVSKAAGYSVHNELAVGK